MEEELQAITVERDFYFGKVCIMSSLVDFAALMPLQLRDIEVLVQEALETEGKDRDALTEIQRVLYVTQVN